MTAFTAYLGLYLPGGGSSGIGGDDEAIDVDRLNGNFQEIDTSLSGFNDRITVVEGKTAGTVQFSGPASERASVTGMERGDTYKETNEKFDLWEYTNAWKMVTPHIFGSFTSTTSLGSGTVTLSWSKTQATHYLDTGEFESSDEPTRIALRRVGWYRVGINVRTNGTGAFTGLARLSGADLPYTTFSGSGVFGAASAGGRTFLVKCTDVDQYLDFRVTGGTASGNSIIDIEYIGDL